MKKFMKKSIRQSIQKCFCFFSFFFLLGFLVSCSGEPQPSEEELLQSQVLQSILKQNSRLEMYSNRLDLIQEQLDSLENRIDELEIDKQEQEIKIKKQKQIPVKRKRIAQKKKVSTPKPKDQKKIDPKIDPKKKLYQIVIGAFRDFQNANRRRNHIRGLGVPVKVEDMPLSSMKSETRVDPNPDYRGDYADYTFFFSQGGETSQDGPVFLTPLYRVITEKSYSFEPALEISQFLISRGYSAHIIEKDSTQKP